MISLGTAMFAVIPASAGAAKNLRVVKPANDDFEWRDWSDNDPLMDAHEFSKWCERHGENEGITRTKLYALAAEFCALRGGVRPPPAERLYQHVKPAGWRSFRGGYITRGSTATRPTLYRLNSYAQAKS